MTVPCSMGIRWQTMWWPDPLWRLQASRKWCPSLWESYNNLSWWWDSLLESDDNHCHWTITLREKDATPNCETTRYCGQMTSSMGQNVCRGQMSAPSVKKAKIFWWVPLVIRPDVERRLFHSKFLFGHRTTPRKLFSVPFIPGTASTGEVRPQVPEPWIAEEASEFDALLLHIAGLWEILHKS